MSRNPEDALSCFRRRSTPEGRRASIALFKKTGRMRPHPQWLLPRLTQTLIRKRMSEGEK